MHQACLLEAEKERIFAPTGPFAPMIKKYLASLPSKQRSTSQLGLTHFFGYAYTVEKITTLKDIKPSLVGRFVAYERARGMTTCTATSAVSKLFQHLMADDDFEGRNPVIPREHKMTKVTEPRPYTDKDLEFLWALVLASNDFALILAFAIGEECGLRGGETCNIRLSDIDQDKKTIFIRLPTKNKQSRTVLYYDKVAEHLPRWLKKRNPACPHDHLIHGEMLAFHDTTGLDKRFKKLLRTKLSPEAFLYHRLRHSWATRLMNTGKMSLPVLKQLGGWKTLSSLEKYVKILPETLRKEYEESYQKIQEHEEEEPEETMSFMDFVSMDVAV